MNIPSKTQTGQVISAPEPQPLFTSNQKTEDQSRSHANLLISEDSAIRRLIVLVPNTGIDEVQIARQVWEFATPTKLSVLLLSMCQDISEEMSLQRTLITLAALIRDPRVAVETHIASGSNWLHGVKTVLAEGDGILCYEQQHVGWRHRPLITVLEALHVPIWTLSGFYPSSAPSPTRWLSKALFWSAVTVTLAGFFYLQTQLNIVADNLAKTTVLSLSVIVEIGLLFFWNSIFG